MNAASNSANSTDPRNLIVVNKYEHRKLLAHNEELEVTVIRLGDDIDAIECRLTRMGFESALREHGVSSEELVIDTERDLCAVRGWVLSIDLDELIDSGEYALFDSSTHERFLGFPTLDEAIADRLNPRRRAENTPEQFEGLM